MRVVALGSSEAAFPGESFTFERMHDRCLWRVVVDVGQHFEIARAAAAHRPHIVVFTHDDEDHIGGAESFFADLQDEAYEREIWMPSDWLLLLIALRNLLAPGATEVVPEERRLHATEVLDMLADGEEGRLPVLPQVEDHEREARAEVLVGALRDLLPRARQPTPEVRQQVLDAVRRHRELIERADPGTADWVGSHKAVADRVLARSVVIAGLVVRAHAAGTLRWFSVDEASRATQPPWWTEGRPGVFTVVNACEVNQFAVTSDGDPADLFLALYALSVQNRRALVTFGHPFCSVDDVLPATGVLFWSDSDGSGLQLGDPASEWTPLAYAGLMTAPHHGSTVPAHDAIWDATPATMRVLLSNNSQDTRDAFLGIPADRRACTRCPFHSKRIPVREVSASALWTDWEVRQACRYDPQCAER